MYVLASSVTLEWYTIQYLFLLGLCILFYQMRLKIFAVTEALEVAVEYYTLLYFSTKTDTHQASIHSSWKITTFITTFFR